MKEVNKNVRVRFAPSPTGNLHIGSLRTALFNWLFARHHGGVFLIRIEDTDVARSTQEYTDSLLESLAWAGILADEPMMHQKDRMQVYQKYAQQLLQEKKAYKCYCTETELQRKREAAVESLNTYQYDKTCRNKKVEENKPHVVRFKVDIHTENFAFPDDIKGQVIIPSEQIDDFVLLRTDGTVTYNFANVIDDQEMKISHVIRGEEHLFNTPKQMLLYRAFGFQAPQFAHIPLILGPSGQKLSKRDGATSVVEYKKDGYLAQALCNYLVRLGWSHGDQELFTQSEMIQFFSLEHVNHSGAKFDFEKLKWVNSCYIKAFTTEEIVDQFLKNLQKNIVDDTSGWTDLQRSAWINLYKDRVSTLKELYDALVKVYLLPTSYDWISLKNVIEQDHVALIDLLQQEVAGWGVLDKQQLSDSIKVFCKKNNYKVSGIAQFLRFVLIGSISGPSVYDMILLLGVQEVKKRMLIVRLGQ